MESDEDFSDDEPKKKRGKPAGRATGGRKGAGRPARNIKKKKKYSESEDEESEEEEEPEEEPESDESEVIRIVYRIEWLSLTNLIFSIVETKKGRQ